MDNDTKPTAERTPTVFGLWLQGAAEARAGTATLRPPPSATSRAAFAECYEQQMTQVIRFIMRNGASAHEAADIAQSTFVLAFEAWQTIGHPPAWLRRVAYRQLVKLRQTKEHPYDVIPDLPGGRCPVTAVELGEQEARVFEALSWLPIRQREVMAWTIDGFTPTEIAHELAITPEAARQSLARARQNLKRALGISKGGA